MIDRERLGQVEPDRAVYPQSQSGPTPDDGPHPRCGIGRKRGHGPHRFRALIMGGVIRLYCPGYAPEGGGS